MAETIDVPAFTFADLLSAADVTAGQLYFLRMDIEGAEYLVFHGILDAIQEKESFLMFVEFHPSEAHLSTHRRILMKLESMGYHCLAATKEYADARSGMIERKHCPNATVQDLYSDGFFMQRGGCEVFLRR